MGGIDAPAGVRWVLGRAGTAQANRAASSKPDSVQLLGRMIRAALADGADPHLVAGVLLEGAALAGHVPAERQPDVAAAMG